MSLTLTLKKKPSVPVEAESICPDRMDGLSLKGIAALPLHHGNEQVTVGDFFRVTGENNGEICLEGDTSRFKMVGDSMSKGRLLIKESIGQHLGVHMSGGEIVVAKNAHDWVGPEMSGGRIIVKGNAGHMVGAAYRGGQVGVTGGEIIVHGNAGNEIGNTMRDGLIAIGGNSGDFTGIGMLAGTVIVLGEMGQRNGASMKRGTIVSMQDAEMLPTFTYACCYRPNFLRLYLCHLRQLGLPIKDAWINGHYHRWSGDSIELNRGEALIFDH